MMVQRDSLGPVRAFARSVVATGRLAATGRLKSPRTYMGSRLQFADGTTSFVFRETVVGASDPADPAATLARLLRPFSTRGSVRYRILSGLRRDDVLRDPELLTTGAAGEQDAWWRLVQPVPPVLVGSR